MSKFEEMLTETLDKFEKPPLPPRGTYTMRIVAPHSLSARGENGRYEIVSFPVVPVEAHDDVDPDELTDYGDISQARNFIEFFFDTDPSKSVDYEKALYSLRLFLSKTLGIDESLSLKQAMADAVNAQFNAQIIWKGRKDKPEEIDAHIVKMAAL